MALKDKNNSVGKFGKSFLYAGQGIIFLIRNERNFKIQTIIALLVIVAGFYFQISRIDWIIVIMLIGMMLSIEALNTAIEKTVDLVTSNIHPLAKYAKDVSAGAALIFAFISVIIGIIIFLPYILRLI